MISQYEKAIRFATLAHAGQVRKYSGDPYIIHPLRVASKVDDIEKKMVAILHDVLEDTTKTKRDLQRAGFFDDVIEGVVAITKRHDEDYWEYLKRVKADVYARPVKIQDICDNLSDLPEGDPKFEKYAKALKFLIAE